MLTKVKGTHSIAIFEPYLGRNFRVSQDVDHLNQDNMVEGSSPHPLLGSCRLILTGMVFLGVYHLMALRFNLSIALVCMTTDPTHNRTNHSMVANQCQEVGGQEEDVRVVELHEEEVVEEEEPVEI